MLCDRGHRRSDRAAEYRTEPNRNNLHLELFQPVRARLRSLLHSHCASPRRFLKQKLAFQWETPVVSRKGYTGRAIGFLCCLTSEFTGPARIFAQVRWSDGLAIYTNGQSALLSTSNVARKLGSASVFTTKTVCSFARTKP